ncbi:MAG: hypothetical protein MUC49_02385 [Raineya sp.]|jgi:hypothetical protein|nr:hypothetical protein [Raineya sp.]
MLKNGDIILFGGSQGFMGKTIRFFDKCIYTHIGIVYFIENKPFLLDMWTKGIELVPVHKRQKIYPKTAILRDSESFEYEKTSCIESILDEWVFQGNLPYDYGLLPRIAIAKRLGLDILAWGKNKAYICSELVKEFYASSFTDAYDKIELITPQDFIRFKPNHFELIEL